MATAQIKRPAIEVPRTIHDVDASVRRIAVAQRALEGLNLREAQQIENIKQKTAAQRKPHLEDIDRLSTGVFAYAEAHRAELIENGRNRTKTFRLPGGGTILWRLTPHSVSLRKVDDVKKALKAAGLRRFLRIKEEVNKEAMLADEKSRKAAAAIKGVTISQHEELVIKPSDAAPEVPLPVEKTAKQLQKAA